MVTSTLCVCVGGEPGCVVHVHAERGVFFRYLVKYKLLLKFTILDPAHIGYPYINWGLTVESEEQITLSMKTEMEFLMD